ncbi:hypothetical protein Tcan_01967 [Toxocara canis]|uniref:Uncharacterized protein n=1 Tax=Toxocara canis TaxID=6265 RepID=A0A0B2VKD3_TOXCA|nr:hypothetical protein Tcan_01967 [Toxocara canis]
MVGYRFQMLMSRYKEAQQCGGLAPLTPSTSQRTARPLRRPIIPQKPCFTPQWCAIGAVTNRNVMRS